MSARIIPVVPFDYVVFGATGDLSQRKLIPALYYRFYDGSLTQIHASSAFRDQK